MIAGRKKDLTYEFDTRVVERESVAECTENGNKNEINKEVKRREHNERSSKRSDQNRKNSPSVLSLVPPESKRYW